MASSTGYEYDNTGAFIRKDPASVLDYTINFTNWLASGDTITGTPTWTADTGITKGTETNTTTAATLFLSGGTAGDIYEIKCVAVTGNGRTVARRFRVKCEELHL